MDKSLCCGCRACENICVINAITMQEDDEGFLYPAINSLTCVNCGQCRTVCPIVSRPLLNNVGDVYALQYKDNDKLINSSSGGVFIGITEKFIDQNGVVFGCVLDENNKAVIIETKEKNTVQMMQGSKYVSSDTKRTYTRVKELLEKGEMVFYSGAPCQIAGLKKFLKKDYCNLFTMDFLCHGMPARNIFGENIKFLEKKYNGSITNYRFRDKSLKGWGHVSSFYVNNKKKYEPGQLNAYFYGFIKKYLNRYSCYACSFRGQKRVADITVGDFWGYFDENIDVSKGVSFVSLNTDNGKQIFDRFIADDFKVNKSDVYRVAEMNSSILYEEKDQIPDIRRKIYKDLKEKGYKKVREMYLIPKNYFIKKIINTLPSGVRDRIVSLYRRKK